MYESFARVYDTFMDGVPYDAWAGHLIRILRQHGMRDGLVLDLGCGTGQMTVRLAQAGYDMIGVDQSPDMLEIAQERKKGLDILYLMQDMREFELYGTVRAVISTCDSLNYMTTREDLLQVFRLVNNYLDPGGLFLFDMNSQGYYETLCADNTFAESRDDCSFIWENSYDAGERINEYDLTLFLRRENGMYERFLETHRERAWRVEEVEALLREAGLKPEGAGQAYPEEECCRHQDEGPAYPEAACGLPESGSRQRGNSTDRQPGDRADIQPEEGTGGQSAGDLNRGTDRILFAARECMK